MNDCTEQIDALRSELGGSIGLLDSRLSRMEEGEESVAEQREETIREQVRSYNISVETMREQVRSCNISVSSRKTFYLSGGANVRFIPLYFGSYLLDPFCVYHCHLQVLSKLFIVRLIL